jgi:CRP-like cAMP-binding protein
MAPPAPRFQPGTNRLLDLLPSDEHDCIFGALQEVAFTAKQRFAEPGEPYATIAFPATGVVSVLVPMNEETSVEAVVVGNEGMVGLPVVLGNGRGPHQVICQVEGGGWSMPSSIFIEMLPHCPTLQRLLQRYSLTFINQTARSSACNRMHDLPERLARWLLLVHDRVPGDEFVLTQEFLSEMLGVRRPSVSLAAQTLQHAGLIRYQWGRITVLNRQGLENAVCSDYLQTIDEYEQVLGASSSVGRQ